MLCSGRVVLQARTLYLQGLDVAVSPNTISRTAALQVRHTSLASLNCDKASNL